MLYLVKVFHVEHSQLKGKVVATHGAYRRTKKYNSIRTLLASAHVKVPIQNEGETDRLFVGPLRGASGVQGGVGRRRRLLVYYRP